jgi:integrase
MPRATRKIVLTDRSLRALKPAPLGKRVTVWDGVQPNLAVRVTDKGRRSFIVVRRALGAVSPTWSVLGQYPTMSLADARKAAREVLAVLAQGKDLRTVREEKRSAAQAAVKQTFSVVAEAFIKRHVAGLRSARMIESVVRQVLIPAWGDRPVTQISRRDVVDLVEAIIDRGGPSPGRGSRRKSGGPCAARHALSTARCLFNWCCETGRPDVSPCDRLKAAKLHGAPKRRDRVLSDDELRAVWDAASQIGYPYGALVRLLMLSGQRRQEIAGATWSEVDLDKAVLTIGAERMKAAAAHTVPLTPTAIEILRSLPRFVAGDYVFSGRAGARPMSGFSKCKKRLDAKIGQMPPYSLHDLRRTVRTRLAELGVLPFIGELILAHAQQGVARIYDLHTYDAEKRDALNRWEAKLRQIVAPEPPTGKVVPLKRA